MTQHPLNWKLAQPTGKGMQVHSKWDLSFHIFS